MKIKFILILAAMLINAAFVSAQVPAEFASGSMTATNGPGTVTPPARLLQNAAGTTYTIPNTTVNVTASTSLQQYTGTGTGTGNPVVMFGANILANSTAPASVTMLSAMNSIGAPANGNFSNNTAGTAAGIDVATNYAFDVLTSVNQWNQSSSPSTNNVRIRMADLTLTFSSPVTNPYLQFVGLGGVTSNLGFATELDLFQTVSTTGTITGTFTKIQGNTTFVVTANQINNGAAVRNSSCATNVAGCGTVRLNGSNITSITLRVYIKGDGGDTVWGTAGNHGGDRWLLGVSLPETVSLSGTVFNDVNGSTDSTVNGTGFNNPSGVQLYANLIDPSDNSVIGSVAVAANGTYTFAGVPTNTGARVEISTVQGTPTNAAPAVTLPTNWVNTGESPDSPALTDGTITVAVAAANVTNLDFGIEQRPTANNNTTPSQANPGGTVSATVPATTFTVSDTGGGTVSSIRITAFPSNATSFTVGTTTYYPNAGSIPGVCPTATCAAFPGAGVTVPTNASGNPTTAILVDPVNGTVAVGIPYVAIDNAGFESQPAATASVPFVNAAISGSVFNDTNGLTDSTVNGVAPGTNAGVPLYANLYTSGGVFLQSVLVTSGGAYTFPGLNNGTYIVQVSTVQGSVGTPQSGTATTPPPGWAYTGENVGTGTGSDGIPNGLLTVTIAGAVNTTNANFGIEQRPTANSATDGNQSNPGGTTSAAVSANIFSATDPVTATVSNIRITAFPSNATSFTVGTTRYYPNAGSVPGLCLPVGTTCAAFPAGGVTIPTNAAGNPTTAISIDPVDGAVTVNVLYVAVDEAGIESLTAATAAFPFGFAPTAADGSIAGTLRFGNQLMPNTLVVLTDTTTSTKSFTRTDANGSYIFAEQETGRTYIVQPLSSKYTFSPGSSLVSLVESVAGLNFNSSAKAYHPKNDFDGDGISDVAVFRPTDGNWYVLRSSDAQMNTFKFGAETDVPVSADFDGDGKTDYAVYRPSEGNWYIWQSATQDLRVERFGAADDKLVPADYDGDGKADVAVYRGGTWYIRRSSDGGFETKHYGADTDTPLTGDFDNDGKSDFSVYRPADGTWYTLLSASGNSSARRFGAATDVPTAADFDGDGYADIAQFRSGIWYILNSTTDFEASRFGTGEDKSIVGDYDGDGRADTTTFRDGLWTIHNSADGTIRTVHFGLPTDITIK